ncbi:heat shock protein DnaJ, partial [Piedraia hortae CBS 480.64]
MSSLPEDPYLALGVDRNATTAQIKAQYRKLALKCHPDKVLDPEKKEEAVAEFHKIQTAFEILGDESKRNRY